MPREDVRAPLDYWAPIVILHVVEGSFDIDCRLGTDEAGAAQDGKVQTVSKETHRVY